MKKSREAKLPTEADLIAGGMPKSWACVDCGVNTAPKCPNAAQTAAAFKAAVITPRGTGAGMTIDDRSEVYAVFDNVWKAANMGGYDGCLCIGCLEKRLGRILTPKDFDRKHAFHDFPGTARLLARREAFQNIEGFTERLVSMANGHMQEMLGMTEEAALEYIKKVIAGVQIAFGVYQDKAAPGGVGLKIIKGEHEMQGVVTSGDAEKFAIGAIPCISAEQAAEAAAELGDGKRKTN